MNDESKTSAVPGMAIAGCFLVAIAALWSGISFGVEGEGLEAAACYFAAVCALGIVVFVSFKD